jgi:hypothetical protein
LIRNQEGILLIWRLTQGKGIDRSLQGKDADARVTDSENARTKRDAVGTAGVCVSTRQSAAAAAGCTLLAQQPGRFGNRTRRGHGVCGRSKRSVDPPRRKPTHALCRPEPNRIGIRRARAGDASEGFRLRQPPPRIGETAQHVSRAAQRARFELRRGDSGPAMGRFLSDGSGAAGPATRAHGREHYHRDMPRKDEGGADAGEQGGEAASSSSLLESIVARGAGGETENEPAPRFRLVRQTGRLFCCLAALAAQALPSPLLVPPRRGARDDRTRTHSHALDTGGGSAGRYPYDVRAINRPRLTD